MGLRILVCGGRTFLDAAAVFAALDQLDREAGVAAVIHGCARGADTLAGAWAVARGKEEVRFPAAWQVHGRTAGFLRNQRMLDEGRPDRAVVFPGGAGTADMARRLAAAAVPIWRPIAGQGHPRPRRGSVLKAP